MFEEWTPEEEAKRLRERFSAVKSKAAFARENHLPGGASMLSQHLSGHRPLSLSAATAYAKGFGVTLWEISPRLAREVAAANYPQNNLANVEPGPDVKGFYPLLSSVQAGMWTELCASFTREDAQDWHPSTKNLGPCGYMLRVKGKSMENHGGTPSFSEGMILHINPDIDPTPGLYVIVRRNGTDEATFKKYIHIDGIPYLEAINPDWPKDQKYLKLMPGDTWCGVVVDASLGGLI